MTSAKELMDYIIRRKFSNTQEQSQINRYKNEVAALQQSGAMLPTMLPTKVGMYDQATV